MKWYRANRRTQSAPLRQGKNRAARLIVFPGMICMAMLAIVCPGASATCDAIPAGQRFWIRLEQPVASYSAKVGDTVRALVIEPPDCEGSDALPSGTEIDGRIALVKKVGLGFVHEAASVEIRFDRLILPTGDTIPVATRVEEVDNARETVKKGVIHGVLATDTPQGRITSRLKHLPTWNPYTDWFLFCYRSAFPVFPEPEIYLPPGVDLKLELTAALPVSDTAFALPEAEQALSPAEEVTNPQVDPIVPELPTRTMTRRGEDSDIVNLMFIGSREEVVEAFTAAGWMQSDPTTKKSVMRQFHALLAEKNYPTAPMSAQLVDGEASAMTWQKAFDSYEKREHLRIWSRPEEVDGKPVWIAAYTRETGATFSIRRHAFIHHVDSDVDMGRELAVTDLSLAGCVQSVEDRSRPSMPRRAENATGDTLVTGGTLVVVQLKGCSDPMFQQASGQPLVPVRPQSKLMRYVRMQVLSFRSDVVRGNCVYGAFDLMRMGYEARKNRRNREAVHAAPVSQATPQVLHAENKDTGGGSTDFSDFDAED